MKTIRIANSLNLPPNRAVFFCGSRPFARNIKKTARLGGFKILVRAKYFGGFATSPRNPPSFAGLTPSRFSPLCSNKKTPFRVFQILVRAKGLEPSTSTLARLRSSQLSYARIARIF